MEDWAKVVFVGVVDSGDVAVVVGRVVSGCVTPVVSGCLTTVVSGCVTLVVSGCVTTVVSGCVTLVVSGCVSRVTRVIAGCVARVAVGTVVGIGNCGGRFLVVLGACLVPVRGAAPGRVSQLPPVHPGSHSQTPRVQMPWPEQPLFLQRDLYAWCAAQE